MLTTIRVPDIGTDSADVIEILVRPGQQIGVDTAILVLESAKASMEVPCPQAGVIQEVLVKVGDKVKEGTPLLRLVVSDDAPAPQPAKTAPAAQAGAATESAPAPQTAPETQASSAEPVSQPESAAPAQQSQPAEPTASTGQAATVSTPDIGSDSADVIEVLVQPGQQIEIDTPIVVLESAKASMEVPSPQGGTVAEVLVKVGDKVKEGVPLLRLEGSGTASAPSSASKPEQSAQPAPEQTPARDVIVSPTPNEEGGTQAAPTSPPPPAETDSGALIHCGPAVRRLARELGVDLHKVVGTGPKERIVKEDVHAYVNQALNAPAAPAAVSTGSGLPSLPEIDFSKWGPVDTQPLTKIQKLSAQNLHRAWVHIPHVTQFDEADITELEAFRLAQKDSLKAQGVSLTILAFLVRACAHVLRQFPKFNASLSLDGEQLILKQYVHIGVAVDTPNGLVVPVIRDADRKSIAAIARELGELSAKARDKKLSPAEMQGASFTISSLGGIGGTAFTPIVNWPEVAILGVSRASQKPVWNGEGFVPRLMLPLSLSYDHRVVDGADGARFVGALGQVLADIRRILL